MAHRLSQAHCLCLQIEFYLNTAALTHLHVVCGGFCAARAEWSSNCHSYSLAYEAENIYDLALYIKLGEIAKVSRRRKMRQEKAHARSTLLGFDLVPPFPDCAFEQLNFSGPR